ncbi:MAG: nitroreductase family protein [Allosphingosinicella sp.]
METDARSLARSYRHDPELSTALPVRPSLVPGILAVPMGADALIIVGGDRRVLFKGKSARGQFLQLLPSLDGTRTLEDLTEELEDIPQESIFEVLCLLHSNGLTMEGSDSSADPLGLFAARYIGHSRQHPNGTAASRRLADTRLLIVSSEQVRGTVERELRELGFGEVAWKNGEASPEVGPDHDVALVIASGESAQSWLQHCWAAGLPAFRIATDQRLEIGPLILPIRSACAACVTRALPPIADEPGRGGGGGGLAIAVHRFAMTWSLLANNEFHNSVMVYDRDRIELVRQKIIREPGCETCGLGPEYATPESTDEVFRTHFRSEIAPKQFLSPSYHMAHYSAKNIDHTKHKLDVNVGARPIPLRAEVLEKALGKDHWMVGFARLLELCFGYRTQEAEGIAIRFVPSGGGLDSPTPYVALRGIGVIPDGIYRFSPDALALEPVPSLTGGKDFFEGPPTPQAILLVLAAQARVAVKYMASATRICSLDAGVSLHNAVELARALKLQADFSTAIDSPAVLGELNMSRSLPTAYFPTYAAAFGEEPGLPPIFRRGTESPLPDYFDQTALSGLGAAPGLRIDSFEEAEEGFIANVQERRTSRVYEPDGLERSIVEKLLDRVRRQMLPMPLLDCELGLSVVVTRDGPDLAAGVYQWSLKSPQLEFTGPLTLAPREFINQTSLAQAPVLLFATADLYEACRSSGYAGYRNALISAGAIAGALWTTSTELGLSGCVAGGLIESAVRISFGIDGYTKAPLVAYVVGRKPEATR